jgi:hypothetical protein
MGGKSDSGSNDSQVRPSLDHIMTSFQEMAPKNQLSVAALPLPAVQKNTPSSWGDHESIDHAPVEKLTIDIAPPIITEETKVRVVDSSPVSPPLPNRKPLPPVRKASLPPTRKPSIPAIHSVPPPPSPPPTKEVELLEEDNDGKLKNALADLEGVSILLDSVLEVYLSMLKNTQNEKAISTIESKLNHVADKISQTVQKPTPLLQNTSPETVDLLEKYSSLLLSMVENKLNK